MHKKALEHFKKTDPTLHTVAHTMEEVILSIHPDPFMRLTRSIVGQQLSVKAASTIYSRFEKLFKKGINPEELIKLPDEKMRACGISFQKIKYLKDLAQKTIDQEIDFKNIGNLSNEEVIGELTKIKGIGQWTAEMFLMFSLGREDVFSFGDMGLQNAITKLYKTKGKKPTIKDMERLSQKWSPFRTYAALALWHSLDNEPK